MQTIQKKFEVRSLLDFLAFRVKNLIFMKIPEGQKGGRWVLRKKNFCMEK